MKVQKKSPQKLKPNLFIGLLSPLSHKHKLGIEYARGHAYFLKRSLVCTTCVYSCTRSWLLSEVESDLHALCIIMNGVVLTWLVMHGAMHIMHGALLPCLESNLMLWSSFYATLVWSFLGLVPIQHILRWNK